MWQPNCLQQQVKNQLNVALNNRKCDFKWYPILTWNNSNWTIYFLWSSQEEVKRKINIENDILVGLYRKRGTGELSQNDQNEISSREATLKNYMADLK